MNEDPAERRGHSPTARQKAARVLHALDPHTIGGIETCFCTYLQHPASRELDHHVLMLGRRCRPEVAEVVAQHARSAHWAKRWHGVKLPAWPRFLRGWNLGRILRTVKPDVVVAYNAFGHTRLFMSCLRRGLKIIYYERSEAWQAARTAPMSDLWPRFHLILCISHAARRMLELRCGLPQGVARVLYNPIRSDVAAAEPVPKALVHRRSLRLGVAGRLVPLKGFALALHALHRLRREGIAAELHIAGIGPEEGNLRRLADRLGISAFTRFHGFLSRMAEFYRDTDIFICPSVREPFGNQVAEASFAGCAVICAAVDGLPEIVLDGRTGLCVPPTLPLDSYRESDSKATGFPEQVYNPSSDALEPPKLVDPAILAEKVRYLYEHPDLFAEMGRAAHRLAAEKFSLNNYMRRYNHVLQFGELADC
jgi:glycosyltransferase involved in cell wall biosynthesis